MNKLHQLWISLSIKDTLRNQNRYLKLILLDLNNIKILKNYLMNLDMNKLDSVSIYQSSKCKYKNNSINNDKWYKKFDLIIKISYKWWFE